MAFTQRKALCLMAFMRMSHNIPPTQESCKWGYNCFSLPVCHYEAGMFQTFIDYLSITNT